MSKLVIDRSRWLRGLGGALEGSALLDDVGGMCCLGFLAESCGVDLKSYSYSCDRQAPYQLTLADRKKLPEELFYPSVNNDCSGWAFAAMELNDCSGALYEENPEQREAELAEHFAKIGIELEFVG